MLNPSHGIGGTPMKSYIFFIFIISAVITINMNTLSAATVIHKGEKVYIQDRTGVQWDVSQARSIGFKPEVFQHGIGKNAFRTLEDTHLKDEMPSYRNPRVIGIEADGEAQAYAVPKMRRHEIANTHLGDQSVAVGY
jgi:Protein of unknown function (DUF3179)